MVLSIGEVGTKRVLSVQKAQSTPDWNGQMRRISALALILGALFCPAVLLAKATTRVPKRHATAREQESAHASRRIHGLQHSRPVGHLRRASLVRSRRHRYYERFTGNSFVDTDVLTGDTTSGEDPVVRQAA